MIVVVCGDRNWTNRKVIKDRLSKLSDDSVVVHGACRGADLLAKTVAEELGLSVVDVHANWKRYGYSAGPIRNRFMVEEIRIHRVIAFHNDLTNSKGTRDCVRQAKFQGIPIEVITE